MQKNSTPLGWFDSALSEHDGILAVALRAGRVGLWSRNLLTDRADWSAQAHEIFGTDPATFDGSTATLMAIIDPEDRAAVSQAVHDAIVNHTDVITEFRIRLNNGEMRWIGTQGHAVYDPDGKPTQMFGVAADITERKRAETARSHLAAIVESSDDAIISTRLDQTVVSWNAAASRLFGFSAEEMIGKPVTLIVPPELYQDEEQSLARIRRGERIDHYETYRVTKDGRRVEVSVSVSPVRDEQGRIVGASKIVRDVGALREVQRELRKAIQEREQLLESERSARSEAERLGHMKDEFLATLSHELRTPLNAIQGWATLLRQRRARPEDFDRGLETIDRNVRTQAQIVNDLLDMSRIISGKIHLEVQPVYLHEVINNAIEAVRQSAIAKNIRIQPVLDSRIGLVRGDPSRLQQVLWNLLSNAIKFTPKGGRIQVVLERVNSHVEICVEDNGIGIRGEFLPHVFDRFRQEDPSTTRRYGGLGLGLSIVKNLVELHGGTIRVKSAGENQGSTFIVSLPISHVQTDERGRDTRRSTLSDPLETIELPRLDKVRVLIVDDEGDGRALIARILEDRGAKTTCASNAQQALEALEREQFDLLLSDIGMPDVDGFELIRRVRQLEKLRTGPLPAIAITAYARAEDRQRSLLAGFHMHLSKPIEPRELIASIAGLIRLSQ